MVEIVITYLQTNAKTIDRIGWRDDVLSGEVRVIVDKKRIGQRIRRLRELSDLSKRKMAKMIGVSYSSMCQYEYGLRLPSDEVKVRIANLFHVSVEVIFFEDEYHENE